VLNKSEKESNLVDNLDDPELPYNINLEDSLAQSEILNEYYDLIKKQSNERDILLERIDYLISQSKQSEELNEKVSNILKLLQELRNQYSVPTNTPPVPKSVVKVEEDEVNQLPQGLNPELRVELELLNNLLTSKKEEVLEKDLAINELNTELETITNEKEELIEELEKMNQVIESWKTQIELLEKLAATDPRYRIIGALKKHDTLTEIQLAFSLGTSVMQIRKFVNDLKELGLVAIDRSGKLKWIGKNVESDLF
jgi:hypothetical protein